MPPSSPSAAQEPTAPRREEVVCTTEQATAAQIRRSIQRSSEETVVNIASYKKDAVWSSLPRGSFSVGVSIRCRVAPSIVGFFPPQSRLARRTAERKHFSYTQMFTWSLIDQNQNQTAVPIATQGANPPSPTPTSPKKEEKNNDRSRSTKQHQKEQKGK